MTFKKIMVAVDFSPASNEAMRVATRIANDANAELVVVHSWYVPGLVTALEPLELATPQLIQRIADTAQSKLDEAVALASELGATRVTGKLLAGPPWVRLTEFLDEDPDLELAIVGAHGHSAVERFLIGSVAERLVRHAPCSVLVTRTAGKPELFTDVLCPVDFSDNTHLAARLAARLVQPGGSGLTLLHVVEAPVAFSGEAFPPGLLADLDKSAARALEGLAAEARAMTGQPVITRTRLGSASSQTLAVLENGAAGFDLVVMGSHGRTGIRRALLGSVAERIVRNAGCSVLVARARTAR
jgi:nucleotide-binding universal stress UspA family protein